MKPAHYCVELVPRVGWVVVSASWLPGSGWTLAAKEQQIIFLILSLYWWFNRAYTNGLTAELNRITTSEVASKTALMASGMKYSRTYTSRSVPQQTPNMVVTTTTIKVTRFRTFSTPCVWRNTNLIKTAYDQHWG